MARPGYHWASFSRDDWMNNIRPELMKTVLRFQRDEVESAAIYGRMAERVPDRANADVMRRIAREEVAHAAKWESVTGRKVAPRGLRVAWYVLIARVLGLTFTVKKLEKGESEAQDGYRAVLAEFPDMQEIIDQEKRHEEELIAMIDEERLKYAGSVVLGLNDALVELTGALAGFTLAFQNTRLIAMTGLITGISASLSMASSEYLSQRSDAESTVKPGKSAIYTGTAYVLTVILLVLPFFLTTNFIAAMGATLGFVILIILGFNYYLCTARDLPFRRHFLEMFAVSMGVTAISFGVGLLVKKFLGVEI
jgi:VIT1/CCC1 family predicted Fe2+/Mn2+ transporter